MHQLKSALVIEYLKLVFCNPGGGGDGGSSVQATVSFVTLMNQFFTSSHTERGSTPRVGRGSGPRRTGWPSDARVFEINGFCGRR